MVGVKKEAAQKEISPIKGAKAETRITINSMLVGVAATVLFIIIAVNAKLLQENFWLSLQLVLITPFLIISSLAYSKLAYKKEQKIWNLYAWTCFVMGYCFMINVIAILISAIGLIFVGVLLLAINLALHYIYAAIDHKYGDGSVKEEIFKYTLLTLLNLVLGLWVILHYYAF